MTLIIKSSALDRGEVFAQSFGRTVEPSVVAASAATDPRDAQIAALESEIRGLEERRLQELVEAREAGAREALEERSESEAAALAELGKTLGEAQALWSQSIKSLKVSSIGIAQAVLKQVFTDHADLLPRIESAIDYQLQKLEDAAVVRLRVSGDDFSDPDALAALAASFDRHAEVASDPKLESGACIIDLSLGQIDLGLPAQWARISELLERLEREGAGA